LGNFGYKLVKKKLLKNVSSRGFILCGNKIFHLSEEKKTNNHMYFNVQRNFFDRRRPADLPTESAWRLL
jgi:hypothetical protein